MSRELIILLSKRLLSSLLIIFLLITFIFFLLRIAPGDPTLRFISPTLSPELSAAVKESFNLNESPVEQYFTFLTNLIKGDFGISYNYRIPVEEVIKGALPFTFFFAIACFAIQLSIAFLLASFSIKNPGGFWDKLFSGSAIVLFALPSFVTGVILIYFFSELLHLLPSSGLKSFGMQDETFFTRFFDYAKHLILPIAALAPGGAAVFYKYIRDNLSDIFNKNFILYLKSNGIPGKKIFRTHVIPNAVSPLISIAGIELGILFSGVLIVEVIFGLPGMGRLAVDAILSRDYPLVTGCTFTAGVLVVLSNLAADILKAKVDKRLLKGI